MSSIRPKVDFYFSFVSLWSYIGSQAFTEMIAKHNLEVNYIPVDLHAIFEVSGGLPVTRRSSQRQAYRFVEMQRWRDIRNISLVLKPKHHPSNPEIGHRMLLAALAGGNDVSIFVNQALRVLWVDDLDIEDPAVMIDVANRSGLDGYALFEASQQAVFFDETRRLTREAAARQVFGTPFYFYEEEPFWGQDRLDLLEAAIVSRRSLIPFTLV